MKRLYSAPTIVNLELTELCNVKCRHCYNFWRDESMGHSSLNVEKLDHVLDKIIEAGVFHVVLTGGEPFTRFDILEHGLRRLQENNISVSVNSNLMLADDEKCKKLASVGVDHILTSMPSCDPAVNDYIMHSPGAFEKVIAGIETAVRNNIRVSVNMVITKDNMHQVYDTAKLVSDLGAQKIFVTRAVPPTYSQDVESDGYLLSPDESRMALDDAIRARDELGIMIGSLVSYPLCFLSDLEKYKDFVGRGCPSQSGNRMSINANGETHACVHEEEGYGSVFEKSVVDIFQNDMRKWHDSSFHFSGCEGCPYIDVCESGCSMSALAAEGAHDQKDPLFVGPHAFTKHFDDILDPGLVNQLRDGTKLSVPKRLRFRQEDGFTLLNIRWGNTISISDETAAFLKKYQASGNLFTLEDFGTDEIEYLTGLVYKGAIDGDGIVLDKSKAMSGLSINLEALSGAA